MTHKMFRLENRDAEGDKLITTFSTLGPSGSGAGLVSRGEVRSRPTGLGGQMVDRC